MFLDVCLSCIYVGELYYQTGKVKVSVEIDVYTSRHKIP